MSDPLTPRQIQADVAQVLHRDPAEDFAQENLFEEGLDSIRLLMLVERWRGAGVEVTFPELAERPTLAQWQELLAGRIPAAQDG